MSKRISKDPFKSCIKCRMVWHRSARLVKNYYLNSQYEYYKDFPHYGLDKVDCPKCKEVTHELSS